jgi:hypothetical protein
MAEEDMVSQLIFVMYNNILHVILVTESGNKIVEICRHAPARRSNQKTGSIIPYSLSFYLLNAAGAAPALAGYG